MSFATGFSSARLIMELRRECAIRGRNRTGRLTLSSQLARSAFFPAWHAAAKAVGGARVSWSAQRRLFLSSLWGRASGRVKKIMGGPAVGYDQLPVVRLPYKIPIIDAYGLAEDLQTNFEW